MTYVPIYKHGDYIRHKKSGNLYTVDHVIIAGYTLKIHTVEGDIFLEEEIEKI